MKSHSRCAKDSASCDTKFCLREHRVLADVLLKNFVAAAVFSVSYFLSVVEEFRSRLSKPEGSVCPFGLSIGRAVMTAVCCIFRFRYLSYYCSWCCLNSSSFSFNVSTNYLLCVLYDFS